MEIRVARFHAEMRHPHADDAARWALTRASPPPGRAPAKPRSQGGDRSRPKTTAKAKAKARPGPRVAPKPGAARDEDQGQGEGRAKKPASAQEDARAAGSAGRRQGPRASVAGRESEQRPTGSIRAPPTWAPKWRCGPVARPVVATVPIGCAAGHAIALGHRDRARGGSRACRARGRGRGRRGGPGRSTRRPARPGRGSPPAPASPTGAAKSIPLCGARGWPLMTRREPKPGARLSPATGRSERAPPEPLAR